ncbi:MULTISPECIES: hypothetical protein [unclassified Clostridium]|uniref:hypothetical protein n=1 Tax=unclassified Clostridium TaxID=2614128 RepID=UPI0013F0E5AD|nr:MULTISPECIES: hypothetical protein [unclassified Clostridium]NFG61078.1 hypothetical protein [Clostridium botulinum]NFQ09336.1 hypothetical protein [Clostridium botulinum]
MKVLNEEKLEKLKEIEEDLSIYNVESLDLKGFLETLIEKDFIIIIPPIIDEIEDQNYQYITLENNVLKGGSSRKPGNIILNIEDFLNTIIPVSISFTTAISNKDITKKVMGLLGVICYLTQKMKIDISVDQAFVLRVIHRKCKNRSGFTSEECYKEVNIMRKKSNNQILSSIQYSNILDDLCKINCISIENDIIYLKEKIKIKY